MIRNPTDRVDRKLQPRFRGLDRFVDWTQTDISSYSAGGQPTTAVTDKLTFVTDTTAAVAGANLSQARSNIGASGNANLGIVQGGYTTTIVATSDKITYATSTTAAQASANVPSAREGLVLSGNILNVYAFGGGSTSNGYNAKECYKTPFATLTCAANVNGNLSANQGQGGFHSSANASYIIGGFKDGFNRQTTAYKMPFSTETTATVAGANSSVGKGYSAGFTAGAVYGYSTGDGGSKTYDRTAYATDTNSAVSQTSPATATNGPSGHSSKTNGYQLGGYDTGYGNKGHKMPIATEVLAAVTSANKSVSVTTQCGCG